MIHRCLRLPLSLNLISLYLVFYFASNQLRQVAFLIKPLVTLFEENKLSFWLKLLLLLLLSLLRRKCILSASVAVNFLIVLSSLRIFVFIIVWLPFSHKPIQLRLTYSSQRGVIFLLEVNLNILCLYWVSVSHVLKLSISAIRRRLAPIFGHSHYLVVFLALLVLHVATIAAISIV